MHSEPQWKLNVSKKNLDKNKIKRAFYPSHFKEDYMQVLLISLALVAISFSVLLFFYAFWIFLQEGDAPFVSILVALAFIVISFYCLVWHTLLVLRSHGITVHIY